MLCNIFQEKHRSVLSATSCASDQCWEKFLPHFDNGDACQRYTDCQQLKANGFAAGSVELPIHEGIVFPCHIVSFSVFSLPVFNPF